jgi:hypothetical protein
VKSIRLLILVTVLLLLAFFAGWFGLHFFIQSDQFRGWLSKKVSHSLRVDGHFEPLTWEGASFRSAGFSAIGNPKSKLRSVRVTNLSAHFDWSQLLKGQWVIDHISAEKVEAVVGKKLPEATPPTADPARQPHSFDLPNFLPSEFRIEQLYVASADLHWESNNGERGQLVGTRVTAIRRGPEQWDVTAIGGTARHAAYPPMQVDHVNAALSQDSIVIRDAKALIPGGGELQVVGKISTERPLNAQFTLDFSELEANQVLPVEWHLGGKISGHLVYTGDLDRFEHGAVAGTVKIAGAAFDMTNLFQTLHQLAKFGGLNDVRIDSIETHLKYQEHQLELSDIRASYQDQIRVEGAGSITPDRLDGNLLVGLSPRILGWIPGAEEKVFIEQRDGLHWTKVHISGSPNQPKEDLTKRLIGAFRDKMAKEFKGETKDAVKSLLDLLHQ